MLNRKSVGRLIASAALGVGLSAVGAVPAQAGGLGGPVVVDGNVNANVNVDTKTVCKSVLVLAQSAPTVGVTIGGKRHVVNVDAFAAAADVKVCVQVGLNADVRITANVDATNPLCPIVTGNVFVDALATGGGIFVQVNGLDKLGKPLTINTETLEVLPAGADANVPLLLVVCDP